VEWDTGRQGRPATDCYVSAPDQWPNQGCTQRGPESTVGPAFNAAGGGTYAAEWDPEAGHIRTWFWSSGSEPADLLQQTPDPESWGPAYSYFRIGPGNCDPAHFQQMRLVFDTTFCGDMGDPTFANSCPDKAVQGLRCQDFVRMHPEEFTEAYWSISALDVYVREGASHRPQHRPRVRHWDPTLVLREEEPAAPTPWRSVLPILSCLGALVGVAVLYGFVWVKVQKDSGENTRLTALYDHYHHLLSGALSKLPSVPWNWLTPAHTNLAPWSRLALEDKEKDTSASSSAYAPVAQGTPNRLGGGLSAMLPPFGVASVTAGTLRTAPAEASTANRWPGFGTP